MLRTAIIARNALDEVLAVKYTHIFTAPLRGCYGLIMGGVFDGEATDTGNKRRNLTGVS